MIREIFTEQIIDTIKEMCIEANYYLSKDMEAAMKQAVNKEKSSLGK